MIPQWTAAQIRRRRHSLLLLGQAPSAEFSTLVASPWGFTDGDTTVTVTTKDANDDAMAGVVWDADVETITIDTLDCYVTTDVSDIDSDGVDVCTITIQVKHDVGEEDSVGLHNIAASQFVVTVSGTGNTITQPSVATNSAGATTASFVTTEASVTKTITVTCGGLTIGTATVTTDSAGGGVAPGDPFYEMGTTEATVRSASNGFAWSATAGTVTVQEVPAGKTGWGLRHRFGPDAAGEDSSAEQRFTLGRDCSELWIQYDLYVPANFAHRNESPNNNKFLMLWRDTYGSLSGTWQVGYEYQTNSGTTPDSLLRPMSSKESGTNALYVTSSGLNHPDHNAPFIGGTGPITPGGWYQIRHHVKASSATGVADGVMEMWVDGVMLAQMTDGLFRNYGDSPSDTVLRRGYFLGAGNSGWDEETDLYIYGAKFYDTDPGW